MWILLFQTMLYEYAISLTVHISPPQNIWHKNKVPQSCILWYVSVFSKLSLFCFQFSFNDPSKKQPAVTQHKHRRRRGKNSRAGRRLKRANGWQRASVKQDVPFCSLYGTGGPGGDGPGCWWGKPPRHQALLQKSWRGPDPCVHWAPPKWKTEDIMHLHASVAALLCSGLKAGITSNMKEQH